ncbi:hypothetical protein Pmani_029117 [Petrolisthes manimaculis]|uniref:Uncharacterized protein n=1 Tax=Petrolisthes manimaculis TaxID=1843537 RepID=A0AAE1NY82_9EUCA|nr:hypothetical protein Pmani_029117 [Petrolisthes manimaculis]
MPVRHSRSQPQPWMGCGGMEKDGVKVVPSQHSLHNTDPPHILSSSKRHLTTHSSVTSQHFPLYSQITPVTSHQSPHTSHLTPVTSHQSPHTSHDTWLTHTS